MKQLCLCFLIVIFSLPVNGQEKYIPLLERTITISLQQEKMPSALNKIAHQGGFSFSYNSSIISPDETVTLEVTRQPVREVLNLIFKGSKNFKEKGKYLILTQVSPPPKPDVTVVVISGYVEDGNTGEKIPDASVYNKNSLASSVTDEYGFYKIKLDKKDSAIALSVSKKDYRDTLLMITAPGNQYMNISISPVAHDSVLVVAETTEIKDSVKTEPKEEISFPYESEANVQNISDTLYRDIQVSLLPFVGMNGRLSGNIINDYSINLLGGYSLGTRKIELGFFFNLDRGDVSFFQVAGFGNMVGGNVYGVQGSGFFNYNEGEVKAVQLTGGINLNLDETRGVQLAGLSNVVTASADGVLISGLGNFANGASKGVQIAGGANIHVGDYDGPQISALANVATGRIKGPQITALYNYGRYVKGTQIGLLNISDSLSGVPIGLISIVRTGYHKIELSADEVFYTNFAFRTGVRQFYNILMAGIQPETPADGDNVWTFGYGIGTAPSLAKWLDINIDLVSQHVNKGSFTDELSSLNRFYLGFDFHVAKKFSIALGGTLNGYLTRTTYSDYPVLFTGYQPNIIYDHTYDNNVNLKMWFGFKGALRFL